MAADSADESKVFIPLHGVRCPEPGAGRDKLGDFGYYGGRLVLRWRCESKGCRREVGPEGEDRRIVVFHHTDVRTGERVLPDERRPYVPKA